MLISSISKTLHLSFQKDLLIQVLYQNVCLRILPLI
nr:MAG TPA: hypothetical protein [Bacteriophage sp.]